MIPNQPNTRYDTPKISEQPQLRPVLTSVLLMAGAAAAWWLSRSRNRSPEAAHEPLALVPRKRPVQDK